MFERLWGSLVILVPTKDEITTNRVEKDGEKNSTAEGTPSLAQEMTDNIFHCTPQGTY